MLPDPKRWNDSKSTGYRRQAKKQGFWPLLTAKEAFLGIKISL